MGQNKPSIGEKIAGLMIMGLLLFPLWIICYIAYGNIMIIHAGIMDIYYNGDSLVISLIALMFLIGIACITVPLAGFGILLWVSIVYHLITQKDLSLGNTDTTNIDSNINRLANKIHMPNIYHYYNRTVRILTREQQAHADENIQKGEDYQYTLKTLTRRIGDPALQRQLYKMQALSDNMLKYLKSNPEKVMLAHQFIDYYLKEAANFVNHYLELERSNLNTPEIATAKANIKNTLDKFDEAYKQEFSKLIEDKLFEINAEIIVARKMLKEIGVSSPDR